MLKEVAAGSQLHWSQIWSCQQSWASALPRCFRTRVMLVVRGLLLLLQLLALAPSLPPCCPWSSSSTSPSLCSSSCRLQAPVSTQTLQAAHQGITSCTTGTPVETPILRTNTRRLWLAGVSNDSPWSLPHVNRALPAFKECHKLSFSHHLWKNVQCSWSHSVFGGVWQKMSSTLCSWDSCSHLFCIVMERAFLVSRMLAAVTSNPESGLFDQCKPPWTWNLTFCLCVAQFWEKKRVFILINSKNYIGTLSVFVRFLVAYDISNAKTPSSSRTCINKLQCHFPLHLGTTVQPL